MSRSSANHGTSNCTGHRRFVSRREMLQTMGGGLGSIALADLLRAEQAGGRPLPHFAPRAKRVLLLFMSAGVSQVDTFDHKPALARHDGQTISEVTGTTASNVSDLFFRKPGRIMPSPFTFRRYGASGKWVSDLFPHQARHVDDLTFVHSMVADQNSHGPAMYHMSTGQAVNGFPSLGSWCVYGLGTENQNLPSFVVMMDRGAPPSSTANWSNGFLPARYQGTVFRAKGEPIVDLKPPRPDYPAEKQRASFEMLEKLNREHLRKHPGDDELSARIASYELAARMQMSAPDVADVSKEPGYIQRQYGVDRKNEQQATFSRLCLTGRRLLESGVRFVTLFSGGSNNKQPSNWDAHNNLKDNHERNAAIVDQPIGALLDDLKQRGLLEDTLVIWTGEFGRTPTAEKSNGRDHNISGFTLWMAGAGMKPGYSYGATDDIGFSAVQNPVHIPDFHATILHTLGLDQNKLTYYYNGLDRKLTGTEGGRVVRELYA